MISHLYTLDLNGINNMINEINFTLGKIPAQEAPAPTASASLLIHDSGALGQDMPEYNINDLDIERDGGYEFEALWISTAASSQLSLYCNNDKHATNYIRTVIYGASGIAPTTNYANSAIINVNVAPTEMMLWGTIGIQSSENRFFAKISGCAQNASYTWSEILRKSAAPYAKITSLTFSASGTNQITKGSRFRLWKRA